MNSEFAFPGAWRAWLAPLGRAAWHPAFAYAVAALALLPTIYSLVGSGRLPLDTLVQRAAEGGAPEPRLGAQPAPAQKAEAEPVFASPFGQGESATDRRAAEKPARAKRAAPPSASSRASTTRSVLIRRMAFTPMSVSGASDAWQAKGFRRRAGSSQLAPVTHPWLGLFFALRPAKPRP